MYRDLILQIYISQGKERSIAMKEYPSKRTR